MFPSISATFCLLGAIHSYVSSFGTNKADGSLVLVNRFVVYELFSGTEVGKVVAAFAVSVLYLLV